MENIITETQKKIFSTAMLINLSQMFPFESSATASANTATVINTLLTNEDIIKYIGNWSTVWGPYVIESGIIKEITQPLNSMYIACSNDLNPGVNTYLVGIAGTDFLSMEAWFTEDFNVGKTVPLPSTPIAPNHAPRIAKIAEGTCIALNNLLSMGVTESSNDGALAYLKNNVKPGDIVYVCGHSLGGTLTPVFSTYVYAQLPDNTIYSMPIASSATGNDYFKDYYDVIFSGEKNIRIWNDMDVAPHCFTESGLAELSSLYLPTIKTTPLEDKVIKKFMKDTILDRYDQYGSYHMFTHSIYTPSEITPPPSGTATTWLEQAKCQHVAPYGEVLSWHEYLCSVTKIANSLNLGSPLAQTFFTAGCGPQCGISS